MYRAPTTNRRLGQAACTNRETGNWKLEIGSVAQICFMFLKVVRQQIRRGARRENQRTTKQNQEGEERLLGGGGSARVGNERE